MIPGVMVAMGGQQWTVPPLTLGQLRRLMPKVRQLTEIGAQMGETQIGVLVEIVAAALQRNYPDMPWKRSRILLDLGNAGAVLNAVLTGSGLRSRERSPGEAAAPGRVRGQHGSAGVEPGDWGRIYGLLATTCGYSYPVIDAMTLLDVEELTQYWIDHPPLHLMVAAYLGIGKRNAKRTRSRKSLPVPPGEERLISAQLLAELGPSFSNMDVHAGLAPVVLDFAELKRRVGPPVEDSSGALALPTAPPAGRCFRAPFFD